MLQDINMFHISIFTATLLIIMGILVMGMLDRILVAISARNVKKRRSTALLVIFGSLVGTALISGSMVVRDSFEYTAKRSISTQLGEIDIEVRNQEGITLTPTQLESTLSKLESSNDLEIPHTGSHTSIAVQRVVNLEDEKYGKVVTGVTLAAYDDSAYKSYITESGFTDSNLDLFQVAIPTNLAEAGELSEGDSLLIYADEQPTILTVKEVFEPSGLTGFTASSDSFAILVSEQTYKAISPSTFSNIVFASASDYGVEFNQEYADLKLDEQFSEELDDDTLVVSDRKTSLYNQANASETSLIFFALSVFGIFSGILLIINLYSMLAQERQSEMGVLRAIGFTRSKLTRLFIYEGTIYASISSILGSALGVLIGFILVKVISSILKEFLTTFGIDIRIFFDFTLTSLLLSFSIGFLITIITVIFSSIKISRIEIVSAIKNLPPTKSMSRLRRGLRISSSTLLAAGSLSIFAFVGTDELTSVTAYLRYFTLLIGLFYLVRSIIEICDLFISKRVTSKIARIGYTIAGLSGLIYSTYAITADEFGEIIDSSPLFFFFVGIGLVATCTIVISYNIDLLTQTIQLLLSRTSRIFAPIKIAFEYPAANPGRTALTLAMYGLIIFVIVFISIYRTTLDETIASATDSILGGPDINVTVVDRESYETALEVVQDQNGIESAYGAETFTISLPEVTQPVQPGFGPPQTDSQEAFQDSILVLSPELESMFDLEFAETSEEYESDDLAWEDFFKSEGFVIINNFYHDDAVTFYPTLEVGSEIKIEYPDGTEQTKTIFAALTDKGGPPLPFITPENDFISSDLSTEEFPSSSTTYEIFAKFDSDTDSLQTGSELKDELATNQVFNILIAEELALRIQSFTNQFIYLLQGFLSFGLLVGLAGLGVIMTRSVHERRQQVGMIRSLGFTRGMVLASFIAEASLIAALGIAVGAITGSIGGVQLLTSFTQDVEDFYITYPTLEIVLLMLGVFVSTLVFIVPPAYQASRLEPVEATNYPE